tara:strand:+ start:2373 stop:2504 length:132 start_codon:yes stop_codon:yes gene_type:complete
MEVFDGNQILYPAYTFVVFGAVVSFPPEWVHSGEDFNRSGYDK